MFTEKRKQIKNVHKYASQIIDKSIVNLTQPTVNTGPFVSICLSLVINISLNVNDNILIYS